MPMFATPEKQLEESKEAYLCAVGKLSSLYARIDNVQVMLNCMKALLERRSIKRRARLLALIADAQKELDDKQ